jgi:hypothetical protein
VVGTGPSRLKGTMTEMIGISVLDSKLHQTDQPHVPLACDSRNNHMSIETIIEEMR